MQQFIQKHKGIIYALMAAVISGFSIFVNKFALAIVKPPVIFTSVKNILVGIILLLVVLAFNKGNLTKNVTKRDYLSLFAISLIGGAIPFFLFFTGLAQIPAVNGAIIQKTLVLWAILLAVPLLKENFTKLHALALIMLFGSNLFIGGFKGFLFSQGEFFVLLATIFWAVEHVWAKKLLKHVEVNLLVLFRMLGGGLILLAYGLLTQQNAINFATTYSASSVVLFLVTVVSLLLYVSTWYRALKYTQVTTAVTILLVATLITNLLTAIFISHTLDTNLIIYTTVSFLGLSLLAYATRDQNKSITNCVQ